jgi:glyoxylase-like metal-dependent hydrolase (beta-lactamase superfamily II)
MGLAKRMMMEELERTAVREDKELLAGRYTESQEGEEWDYGACDLPCVWCGGHSDGQDMYFHTEEQIACHGDCVEDIRAFEHAADRARDD